MWPACCEPGIELSTNLRRASSEPLPLPPSQAPLWALAAILALGGIVRIGSAPAVGLVAVVLAILVAEIAYGSPAAPKG